MADYNINAVTRRVVFTGSAGLGPYAFTFEVLDQNDLAVYLNTILLTLTTDYTVTINANGTGSVTLVTGGSVSTAPTADDTIVILGARDIERTTDFVTAGDLLASSLNEQLDSNIIFEQQIDERVDRSIKFPPYDSFTGDNELPAAATRADKILKFDTDGNVAVETASAIVGNAVVGANFINNTFTGNGSTTGFTMTAEPGSKNNAQVYIDGVYQLKSSFSVSGTTLTFTEAPPLNAEIEVIIGNAIDTLDADSGNINYNQGGTGAQTRTVESKLQEVVSVKDFGAVGDGVTDDTAAINKAAEALQDAGQGILFFPAGEYIVSGGLLKDTSGNLIDFQWGMGIRGEGRRVTRISPGASTVTDVLFDIDNSTTRVNFVNFEGIGITDSTSSSKFTGGVLRIGQTNGGLAVTIRDFVCHRAESTAIEFVDCFDCQVFDAYIHSCGNTSGSKSAVYVNQGNNIRFYMLHIESFFHHAFQAFESNNISWIGGKIHKGSSTPSLASIIFQGTNTSRLISVTHSTSTLQHIRFEDSATPASCVDNIISNCSFGNTDSSADAIVFADGTDNCIVSACFFSSAVEGGCLADSSTGTNFFDNSNIATSGGPTRTPVLPPFNSIKFGSGSDLSSYEEGVWTPTYEPASSFTSITYDAITGGVYRRIGKLVFASGRIRTDAISGGSGAVSIGGLPFTVGNNNYPGGLTINFSDNFTVDPYGGNVTKNTLKTALYDTGKSALLVTDLDTGANGNDLSFAITYVVD